MAVTRSPYDPNLIDPKAVLTAPTASPWWNAIDRATKVPYLDPNKPRPSRYADYSDEAWAAVCGK